MLIARQHDIWSVAQSFIITRLEQTMIDGANDATCQTFSASGNKTMKETKILMATDLISQA